MKFPLLGGSIAYYTSNNKKSDSLPFDAEDVDASKLQHPYWDEKTGSEALDDGDDDLMMLNEIGEFGSDFDFDLPEKDKGFLKKEWSPPSK
eukprot:CAMPEP_0201477468 /NCGR_PEP_ID=MMETSP0151_2-20130828/2487_1 /ASSEMBLY_ACC=CAM_ASM_000257 /TAXON_ID=200890 /ORGANISM="Paramoeba atlantica, Strain 621/1 / CCAP 1560/9" /LENGTH=90 /DNA_ID=CAMNT_0047858199 /DNA_START=160 /DNA_END=432 /DNA_ORIENTATION=-